MKIAIYGGSFDPFTRGHYDVVRQAAMIFDHVIISRGRNPNKQPLFSDNEAKQLTLSYFSDEEKDRLQVTTFDGPLVKYAETMGACALVRGLRQSSDFNDEFRLHGVNSRAAPMIPMTWLMCHSDFLHVSSSTAREMASLGMDTSWLVNEMTQQALAEKYQTL